MLMLNKMNMLRTLCLLSMLIIVQSLFAQSKKTVTGIVTDMGNEPLIGVTVSTKGNASIGTVTDVDGKYTIEVSSPLCIPI